MTDIERLKFRLEKIERVESVVSILDVPLIDSKADIHLGGIPMIVSDMIDYIEHDISVL